MYFIALMFKCVYVCVCRCLSATTKLATLHMPANEHSARTQQLVTCMPHAYIHSYILIHIQLHTLICSARFVRDDYM